MAVEVRFSEDQRYLIYEMTEPLNMNDLMQAYDKERSLRDSVPYVVHSIVDISQIKRIPANWLVAKAGPGFTHPRSGEILFVGVSVGIKMVVEMIFRIVNYKRMRFFNTRQEADAYMQKLVAQTPVQATAASGDSK